MRDSNMFDQIDLLLVDDRSENLLSLEAVLASPEYNLIKTNSGSEALRYLLDNTPALILMDVQMPNLSGFETASLIKDSVRTREIPIIFITAINKNEQYALQGYEHGAVDYIYKPYDAQVLRSKVAVFAEIRHQQARMARLVAVQRATTHALADSSHMNEAIPKVLQSICVSLVWDLGMFWSFDKRSNRLCCRFEWHDPSRDVPLFLAESFKRSYTSGIGLPGQVWQTHNTLWLTEALKEASSVRFGTASQEGLRTAVALPISVQGEMMGVLEFYSRKKIPEDPDLVKIMGSIGSQIGQVLKRTESIELARASEAQKTAILETALDCIISMDHEGSVIGFNPAAEIAFGYHRSEVLGKKMSEVIIPPAYREAHHRGLKHYLSSGEGPIMNKRIEIVGMRSDGTAFPVELAITRVPGIEPPIFTGFLRDITESKRAEENLSFLVEATAALSLSLNYDETFSALAKLVVKSLADYCQIYVREEGKPPRSVAIAHRDPAKQGVAGKLNNDYPIDWNSPAGAPNVFRTGTSELYSHITDDMLVNASKDKGHLKLIRELGIRSAMVIPLLVRGKTLGVITFVSAESARRYSKEDLAVATELARRAGISIDNAKLYQKAQDAIRARDEFFSIASHELKTPITSLKLLLELTQRGVNSDNGTVPSVEKLAKMLKTSLKQVNQLTHLVEDLLDVVKIRAGKFNFNLETLNLSELVKDLTEQYSTALTKAKCILKLDIEPMVIGIWDATRIQQVVVNLISNAVKYAPGTPVEIHVSKNAELAKIIVRDKGPGITPENHSKIFERFERSTTSRDTAGLGLGLFIVKQIIEAHNGTIRIESDKGKGATFTVELPTNLKNPAPQPRAGAIPASKSNLFHVQPTQEPRV